VLPTVQILITLFSLTVPNFVVFFHVIIDGKFKKVSTKNVLKIAIFLLQVKAILSLTVFLKCVSV